MRRRVPGVVATLALIVCLPACDGRAVGHWCEVPDLQRPGYAWYCMDSGTTNGLGRVWGASATDIWVGGNLGTILHSDGHGWEQRPLPGEAWEMRVGGTGPADVWAVGSDDIFHYDGTSWRTVALQLPLERKTGVRGFGSGQAIITTNKGNVLRFDGQSWFHTRAASVYLSQPWGTAANQLFAVGSKGTIVHYDGTSWTRMSVPTNEDLLGVWGASSSDVFAVGRDGTIVHYDGSRWTKMDSGVAPAPANSGDLVAVVGTGGGDDIYAAGVVDAILRFDGQRWRKAAVGFRDASGAHPSGGLSGLWASPTGEVYAVGISGVILKYTKRR